MVFLPKQAVFFDLLEEVDGSLKNIVDLFGEFAGNFRDFENYAKRAKEIESEADEKTHEIISKLNKTFITPFDREDIYLLAHELDDIIDLIEHVIHSIYLYNVTEEIEAVKQFAPLISQASEGLTKMLQCLRQKKYSAELSATKIRIHELEDAGDAAFSKGITKLFGDSKDAVTIMKMKDILEALENIMDKFQTVTDIIEGIIVKSS